MTVPAVGVTMVVMVMCVGDGYRRGHGRHGPRHLRGRLDALGVPVMQVAVLVAVFVIATGVAVTVFMSVRTLWDPRHPPYGRGAKADERQKSEAAENS